MRLFFIFLYFQSLLMWNSWACYRFCWNFLFPSSSPTSYSFLLGNIFHPSNSNTNEHFLRKRSHSFSQSYRLLLPIAWPRLLQALSMLNLSICAYGSIFSMKYESALRLQLVSDASLYSQHLAQCQHTVGASKWHWVNTKVDTTSAEGWRSVTQTSV